MVFCSVRYRYQCSPYHFTNHVSTTPQEKSVKALDFILPAPVRFTLTIRKQEILAAVEDVIRLSSCRSSGTKVADNVGKVGL